MLTDTAVRNVKAKGRPYKITDGGGLYLLVKPAGKYWRLNYRFADKQQTLALGVYPSVSLAEARRKRDEAKALLAKGINPSIAKAIKKQTDQYAAENTFKAVALEWHVKQAATWAESTAHNIKRYLEKDIFPWLGNRVIKGHL